MRRRITWAVAFDDEMIQSIEDPLLTGCQIDKNTFNEMYNPILKDLDGSDWTSWFDYFFRQSPVYTSHWEFVDETIREDFVDWAQELGLMPTLKEIHEGESAKARARRKN